MEIIIKGGGRMGVPSNEFEAVESVRYFGLPVELLASFVLGGWQKTANSEEELAHLFHEGRRLSPIGEVTLFWELPPCKHCGKPATGDYCEGKGYRGTHEAKGNSTK